MYRKVLVIAAVAATLSAPAFAATTYYLGKVAKTNKCEVTTVKPDGKGVMMIGTATFASKSAAQAAMKSAAGCK
jgi:hypothetical protein